MSQNVAFTAYIHWDDQKTMYKNISASQGTWHCYWCCLFSIWNNEEYLLQIYLHFPSGYFWKYLSKQVLISIKKNLKALHRINFCSRAVFTDIICFNEVPAINGNGSEWRHLEHKDNHFVYRDLIQWVELRICFLSLQQQKAIYYPMNSTKRKQILPWFK